MITDGINTTNYILETKGGVTTLAPDVDYTVNNGIFRFLVPQTDSVFCLIINATFPDLTLYTSNIKITQFPSAVNEITLSGKIYPNPVKDQLQIECEAAITRIEVYTIIGEKVYEQKVDNTLTMALPTGDFPKGILIVKIYGKNGVMERKVVKE